MQLTTLSQINFSDAIVYFEYFVHLQSLSKTRAVAISRKGL